MALSIGTIGKSAGHIVSSKIERIANKQGYQTLTSIRNNRYVIRTDLNNGKYGKTVLKLNKNGVVTEAFSTLQNNARGLKNRLKAFLQ